MHKAFSICCRQSARSEDAVSADDLLSTTIAAIVVAQPQHLISCLEYLKLFHGTGDWSGKTGFQVATLEAAAAYLEQINPACSPLSTAGNNHLCIRCPRDLTGFYNARHIPHGLLQKDSRIRMLFLHVIPRFWGWSLQEVCKAEILECAGAKPRHSQEFVRALLEDDEPLTFASSTRLQSTPVQIPSRHEGVSPDNLR